MARYKPKKCVKMESLVNFYSKGLLNYQDCTYLVFKLVRKIWVYVGRRCGL